MSKPDAATKHPILSTLSGRQTYDEMHMSEDDMIKIVRQYVADQYGINVGKVLTAPGTRPNCPVIVRIAMTPDGEVK